MNKELLGLKFEVVGLILVFMATIWQVAFTDDLAKDSSEWNFFIQEEVNLALLDAARSINVQISTREHDPVRLRELNEETVRRVAGATERAIRQRDERRAFEAGVAKQFGTIRFVMIVLGACLVVAGKWLVIRHKSCSTKGGSAVRDIDSPDLMV